MNWCVKRSGYTPQGSGHIGFLHAMDANNVWLLSGNSKNQVPIAAYPKSKLIHNAPFRWAF